MSIRRSSKIFSNVPGDSNLFLGQAPPGSQRPVSGVGSSIADVGPADVPVYTGPAQELLPSMSTRRKSNVGLLNLNSTGEEDPIEMPLSTKGVRRKSNAALSVATAGPEADLRNDVPDVPGSMKMAPTPKGSGKPIVHIKDSTKRASSRLMIEKEKSIARDIHNGKRPEEVSAEDDRHNGIDCDTCCIFIF